MQTGNSGFIRDINTGLVLRTVIKNGSVSRADIARKLGLTRATVSAIMKDLTENGLICENGITESGQGRKAVLYRLHREQAFHICINLMPGRITVMCADLLGGSPALQTYKTDNSQTSIIQTLSQAVSDSAAQYPVSGHLARICIAVHGTVRHNEITFCPYSPFEGVPFAQILQDKFHVPVLLENEANLSAIGEQACFYPGQSMIFVSVHSGIGIGIILDGHLFRGSQGRAGEFGHSIIEPDGRPCPCGNRGCLEQYASEQAVLNNWKKQTHISVANVVLLKEAFASGDPAAADAVADFERYMSICISNLLHIFDPERIILNSRLIAEIPGSLERIRSNIRGRVQNSVLTASKLKEQAPLAGAVCLSTADYLGLTELDLSTYPFFAE